MKIWNRNIQHIQTGSFGVVVGSSMESHSQATKQRATSTLGPRRHESDMWWGHVSSTPRNGGWCQTRISIPLTTHLRLINGWATRYCGNAAEGPSAGFTMSAPQPTRFPLPNTLALSLDSLQSLLPSP